MCCGGWGRGARETERGGKEGRQAERQREWGRKAGRRSKKQRESQKAPIQNEASLIVHIPCSCPVNRALAEEDDVASLGLRLHDDAAQVRVATAVDQRRGRGEIGLVAPGNGDETSRASGVVNQ